MPENADLAIGPETPDQGSSADEPRTTRLGKLKMLAFAAVVVMVECLVAYLYVPAGAAPIDLAEIPVPDDSIIELESELDQQSEEDQEDLVEVDLGEFAVTSFQPLSGTSLRIDFHLFATVSADDSEDFDLAIQDSRHRIRDQVIVIVRSSDLEDLTDAGLGLIKRKILEKTNRTLGRPLLKTVIFSDFSFIEQ